MMYLILIGLFVMVGIPLFFILLGIAALYHYTSCNDEDDDFE